MPSTSLPTTETYAAAYGRLNQIAERLKASAVTSVDSLVADVKEARAAYAICKARLDAVKCEIDVELAAAQAEEPAGSS